MKKKNNYFKVMNWLFWCAVILTGCADNRGAEEKITVEDGKEEQVEEKTEEPEIESGSVSIEADAEYSAENIVKEKYTFACILEGQMVWMYPVQGQRK